MDPTTALTTTGAAAPTASSMCGTPAQYQIPIKDAACAVPNSKEYPDHMEKCCKAAPITPYNDECAIYCLAVGQNVKDLTDCLFDAGVAFNEVWCNGAQTATATKTDFPTETGKGKGGDGDDDEPTKTGEPSETPGAAVRLGRTGPSTKAGLAVCFVVIPAVIAGMML
ncbi:hypothetical protein FQN51_000609 [Onygenales sp. PD_10]|nr:hypothetical protein FQN51_000609 [Onygenales sp. PD_10]